MDILSRTLEATRLQSSLLATLSLSAPWSIDFEQASGSPAHYVLEGEAWLDCPPGPPLHLAAGDLVMFPRWHRHVLSSTPNLPPVTITQVIMEVGAQPWQPGELLDHPIRFAYGGRGATCELLSMPFQVAESERSPLIRGLPEIMLMRGSEAPIAAFLQPVLRFIAAEAAAGQPGYAVVSHRLSELLFTQIVRAQLLLKPEEVTGWLRGVSDPAVGRALAAMHASPGRRWTIAQLGQCGGMSRSVFAVRFRALTGETPLDYLTRLRMQIAAERLTAGASVKTVAEDLGYATPFSFSASFARVYGETPGRYGRRNRC